MSIDNDIEIEGMCNKCKSNFETKRCNTCGKQMHDNLKISHNPNFDEELFEKMKKESE